MDLGDRATGCIIGLALGDAVGAPFESRRASQIPHPLPALELPWMGLPAGSTTDATAMSRNLVRSLIANEGLDIDDVRRRHIEWLRAGPPSVGTITRRVLAAVSEGETDAARRYVEWRGPEVSAGNGSVMYCAPLGVAYANRPEALVELAPALSAITHWDERCRTACLAVTTAVAALVREGSGDRAALEAVACVADREGGEELEYLVEEAGRARPVDGPDSGFALFTAGLALRAAADELGFEDGLRYVVSLGGDTHANAAVTGAVLGAIHGLSGSPQAWLDRLQDREGIESEAEGLRVMAGRRSRWAE